MLRFTNPDRLDRRTFLGALAGGVVGLTALGCDERAPQGDGTAQAEGPAERPLGVQLYTVRGLMEGDVAGTLRAVAEIGYREVETAGLFGLAPARFRELLDAHALVSPASHMPIEALRGDADAAFATAEALGQRWIVVPWLGEQERTPEGYRRVAGELNEFGRRAAERDLRIGYHNHDFEFEELAGGARGYDILLAETDPERVDLELDLYWASKAGAEPVALFEENPGRFPLTHVKDLAGAPGSETQVAVGEGTSDFGRIFQHAERGGLRHYFVEHDNPADPLASIRSSHAHLRGLPSLQPRG